MGRAATFLGPPGTLTSPTGAGVTDAHGLGEEPRLEVPQDADPENTTHGLTPWNSFLPLSGERSCGLLLRGVASGEGWSRWLWGPAPAPRERFHLSR